jgi:hypothetical protein
MRRKCRFALIALLRALARKAAGLGKTNCELAKSVHDRFGRSALAEGTALLAPKRIAAGIGPWRGRMKADLAFAGLGSGDDPSRTLVDISSLWQVFTTMLYGATLRVYADLPRSARRLEGFSGERLSGEPRPNQV